MQPVPGADEVRALLAQLDDVAKKVLGGLVAAWIAAPQRVHDREWTAEQFVHLATVALGGGDENAPATSDDVERVANWARARMPDVLRTARALFVRTAADLQQRGGTFTFADAQEVVRGYLGRG